MKALSVPVPGTIGMLGPIELAEFADYLDADVIAKAPRGLGGSPVNLLCRELLRRGRRLVILSLDPSVERECVVEGERLRIRFGPYTRKRSHNFFRDERRFLSQAIRRERLSFVHAQWMYEFAIAAIESGLPHVVTAHDAPMSCLPYHLHPFRNRHNVYRGSREAVFWILRTMMAYRAAAAAQRVVAVSPYVAEHLRRYRFHRKPIEVISNGMPSSNFTRRRHRDPDSPFTFATILVGWGGLKNGAVAIEAFVRARAELPGMRMLMFGHEHDPEGPAAAWAHERGWAAGIRFVGQVPYAELIEALSREVDVLVHPALEEAHPMALIEPMSLGIPVIAGKAVGGVPWTLGEGRYGILVDVRSPRGVAAAMLGLARDDRLRRELGAAGRRSVERRFRIEQVADKYEAIYAQLASGAAL